MASLENETVVALLQSQTPEDIRGGVGVLLAINSAAWVALFATGVHAVTRGGRRPAARPHSKQNQSDPANMVLVDLGPVASASRAAIGSWIHSPVAVVVLLFHFVVIVASALVMLYPSILVLSVQEASLYCSWWATQPVAGAAMFRCAPTIASLCTRRSDRDSGRQPEKARLVRPAEPPPSNRTANPVHDSVAVCWGWCMASAFCLVSVLGLFISQGFFSDVYEAPCDGVILAVGVVWVTMLLATVHGTWCKADQTDNQDDSALLYFNLVLVFVFLWLGGLSRTAILHVNSETIARAARLRLVAQMGSLWLIVAVVVIPYWL